MQKNLFRGRIWADRITRPCLEKCEFVPLLEGNETRDRLAYYAAMRSYVQHEDELINSRLTLSLTVHGFLFAAYGLILGKAIDFISSELSGKTHLTGPTTIPLLILFSIMILVALIGAAVGLFSRNAIIAGFNAIQHINKIVHLRQPLWVPREEERAAALRDWDKRDRTGWLLPRVTSGGAPIEATGGAYYYYSYLPMLLFWVWMILAAAALYLVFIIR